MTRCRSNCDQTVTTVVVAVSQSGRRWQNVSCDDHLEESMAAMRALGLEVVELKPHPTLLVCRCGERARGDVGVIDGVPAHFCRQCSSDHCELTSFLRRRGVVTA